MRRQSRGFRPWLHSAAPPGLKADRSSVKVFPMRHLLVVAFLFTFVAVLPSPAQTTPGAVYSIDIDKDNVFRVSREDEETHRTELFVTVQFQIHKLNADGTPGAVTT